MTHVPSTLGLVWDGSHWACQTLVVLEGHWSSSTSIQQSPFILSWPSLSGWSLPLKVPLHRSRTISCWVKKSHPRIPGGDRHSATTKVWKVMMSYKVTLMVVLSMDVKPLPSALVSFLGPNGSRSYTATKSLSTTEQDAL